MPPYSAEQSICEGRLEVRQLFEFVMNNAKEMDAYSMEKAIFDRVMGIGLAAMKCCFAEKGTGDAGDVLELEDGTILKKAALPELLFSFWEACGSSRMLSH